MRHALTFLALLALVPATVDAQPAPRVTAFDVAGSIGLFIADRSDGTDCCSSWSGSFFRGLSAGYYWNDHFKTEAEFAVPGPTVGYGSSNRRLADGSWATILDERTYSGPMFSASQAYQFGRNAYIHPFVFAGVDVDRERVDLERQTFASTFPFERTETSSSTSVRTRAFTGGGFKAYVSERTFFRGEMKLDLGDRIRQVTWKAGVGVDFAPRRKAVAQGRPRQAEIAPRGRDSVDVWRAYATLLPIGSVVDVAAAGEDRVIGTLLVVDDSSVTVRPRTRVPEPSRRIPFERLEQLRLHLGPTPGERFGAVIAGVGTGTGVFFGMLMLLFAAAGN